MWALIFCLRGVALVWSCSKVVEATLKITTLPTRFFFAPSLAASESFAKFAPISRIVLFCTHMAFCTSHDVRCTIIIGTSSASFYISFWQSSTRERPLCSMLELPTGNSNGAKSQRAETSFFLLAFLNCFPSVVQNEGPWCRSPQAPWHLNDDVLKANGFPKIGKYSEMIKNSLQMFGSLKSPTSWEQCMLFLWRTHGLACESKIMTWLTLQTLMFWESINANT